MNPLFQGSPILLAGGHFRAVDLLALLEQGRPVVWPAGIPSGSRSMAIGYPKNFHE
jgi:hypothetical protein